MKRFIKYFLEGLLFLVPLSATVYIIYSVFMFIDELLPTLTGLDKVPPGSGFVVTIALTVTIGYLASNVLTKRILGLVDKLFNRLPLVKLLYSSVKDLIGAFVGDKKSFNKPVLVTMVPGTEIKVIGFVTKDNLENLGLQEQVAVYLPQSYNFAGNLIIVPKNQVTFLEAESSEVMTFIVSGGVAGK